MNWLPLVVFFAIFLPAVVVGLIAAPWQIYKDEAKEREAAERKLMPKLRLSLVDTQGSRTLYGTTSNYFSGRRQTSISQDETILRLTCTNDSAMRVDDCEAILRDIRIVEDDGTLTDIGVRESVNLSWSRSISAPELFCSIAPGMSKAIYVVATRPNATLIIWRGKEIPVEYQQIMVPPATYRVWVRAVGKDTVFAEIALDVRAIHAPKGALINASEMEAVAVDPLLSKSINAIEYQSRQAR